MRIPKVLAIHDISCAGRASLTVILPVLAAYGIEAIPLPTAVLSNHLAFSHVSSLDFTPYMQSFMDAWDRNGISFDGIYSGYLASPEQVYVVKEAIKRYGVRIPVIIDPAMADHGRFYSGQNTEMVEHMRHLIRRAHVIKPNYTEACFLAGVSCDKNVIPDEGRIDYLLDYLGQSTERVIITSIPRGHDTYCNISLDKRTGEKEIVSFSYIPFTTYGTGDIFSSIVMAGTLKNIPLAQTMRIATAFLQKAIEATAKAGTSPLEGILFENMLPELTETMERAVTGNE